MYQRVIDNFWGEKAFHVPNVTDLFGYQAESQFEGYGSRILAALPEDHQIILPVSSKKPVEAKLAYFKRIGLRSINIESIDFVDLSDGGSLSEKALHRVNAANNVIPYIRSDAACKLRAKVGMQDVMSREVVRRLNNKCYFRGVLEKKGLRTPLSFYLSSKDKDIFEQCSNLLIALKEKGYEEFVVSLAESYSGNGTFRFETAEELQKIIRSMGEKEFLISPWYSDIIGQPSFQVYIGKTPEEDIFMGMTDQIISGASHLGNVFPSEFANHAEVQDMIQKAIELLREEKAYGPVGVDLFVRRIDGKEVVYIVEANVRQTAAFYPELLIMKLFDDKRKFWSMRTFFIDDKFSLEGFEKSINDKEISYRYGDEEGVLITNVSTSNNECVVMTIADSKESLNSLEAKLGEIKYCAMNNKKIGLWMYRNEGGDVAQVKLKEKLEARGFEVISDFDLRKAYYKNGSVYTEGGFNLSSLDVLYHMNLDEKTEHVNDILKAIEYSGVLVLNDVASHFLAADKFYTNVMLKKAGIPVADSLMISVDTSYQEIKGLLNKWEGIIVKPRFSRGGEGIVKVQTVEELEDLMGILRHSFYNVYLERYLPSGDHDYRVELLNGEVVGCYSRVKGHSFKTNVHTGGRLVYLDDYKEPIELAKKAASTLGIAATIVDVLRNSKTGEYVVIEVNEIMGMFLGHVEQCDTYAGVGVVPKECIHDDVKMDSLVDYLYKKCEFENE